MSEWGRRIYGEPCRECRFSWDVEASAAQSLVARFPADLADLLADARGDERHPTLAWSVTAYVAHVADNLRIWAERLAGVTSGSSNTVAPYDENALAKARVYEALALPGALWTLQRSVRDWLEAVAAAPPELVIVHPERGPMSRDEVVRSNAHDGVHHAWDIRRTLASLK